MSRWIQALGVVTSIAFGAGCASATAPEQPSEEDDVGISVTGLDGEDHRIDVIERTRADRRDIARVSIDDEPFELVLGPITIEVRNGRGQVISRIVRKGGTVSVERSEPVVVRGRDRVIDLNRALEDRLDRGAAPQVDESIIRAVVRHISEIQDDEDDDDRDR